MRPWDAAVFRRGEAGAHQLRNETEARWASSFGPTTTASATRNGVVVAGAPTVRTSEGERELRPGDIVSFPGGAKGAHTFLNHSNEDARVALFSTLNRPTLPVYPDSGKVGTYGKCFRLEDAVDYWEGEGPG